jgi:Domain of unknown function (DUF4129)
VAPARRRPGSDDSARVVTVAGALAAGALAGGPPGGAAVTRGAGQRLARSELSKRMYHPGVSLTERIVDAIGRLLQSAQGAVPGGWWAVVALAALAVLAGTAILRWIGPVARPRARAGSALLPDRPLSARDHRAEGERLAAAGDFAGAIIESLRAVALELEERGLLPPRVGRTADELAAEASAPLPGQAARLREAARLFDEVRYGGRAGTMVGYRRLRDLDAAVSRARTAS